MATLGTLLYTWRKGELVGQDHEGNKYYRERDGKKRWVIYANDDEPSRVPPEWHLWLHYTVNETPVERPIERQKWEKDHLPNLTGSALAYKPPGHLDKGGKRSGATGDYEAWSPE